MLDSVSEERAHHYEGGHPMGWPPSFATTEQTRTGTPQWSNSDEFRCTFDHRATNRTDGTRRR